MNNVLIISPFCPYPLSSGGHHAIYSGIAILKDFANVYVYFKTTESQFKKRQCKEFEQSLPFIHTIPYIEPNSRHTFRWYCKLIQNKIDSTLNLTSSTHKNISKNKVHSIINDIYDISKDEVHIILEAIKKYDINIVQIEMTPYLALIKYLPKNLTRIFVHHEIKFVRDELILNNSDNITNEEWQHYRHNKKEEIDLLNLYDNIITLSDIDTRKLVEAGVRTRIVTSFGVVFGTQKINTQEIARKNILTFIGPEYHYPNYEGILWFLQNCWDKLRARFPNYSFQIIGKWSEKTSKIISSTYENVHFCGYIENIEEMMLGTTMIVPINIGSGIRMKILEAAQIGVPVVSTAVGAEGLPLENGKCIFIASNAEEFVEDIIKLQEKDLRRLFIENSREAINEYYSLEALGKNRRYLYQH